MLVKGWASKPTLDHYRHVVVNGAFAESIRQKGLNGPRGIKFLWQHEREKPLGPILKLTQRNEGLWIEADIEEKISYGKDVAAAVASIGGLSFSVGFYLTSADIDEDSSGREFLIITEGELEEISAVVFPGNADATMEREEKDIDPLEAAIATFSKVSLALNSGTVEPNAQLSNQLAEMKRIFES